MRTKLLITMDDYQREALRVALERTDGHKVKAARRLKVAHATVYRLCKRLGLEKGKR